MSKRAQAVLFDLDGTLIDSLRDLAEAMNAVLAEDGLPAHPVDAFRYFVGDGVGELVKRALPHTHREEPLLATYITRYRESYEARWHRSPLFPGIADLLNELQRRSVRMAVISNKPDHFTQRCVETLFPGWRFDLAIGQSEAFPRKPQPDSALEAARRLGAEPSACLFVGDSAVDMQTGVNARMIPVGVTWGFRPVTELEEAGAQYLIDHPSELLPLV